MEYLVISQKNDNATRVKNQLYEQEKKRQGGVHKMVRASA
jgi:hypothetical protein